MSMFSLLPASLAVIETWLVRIFLLLGLLTIGPWLLLIVYDLLLYCLRAVAHEVPLVGGRARGARRPRAPSLTERPSGEPRRRWGSIVGLGGGGGVPAAPLSAIGEDRERPEEREGRDEEDKKEI